MVCSILKRFGVLPVLVVALIVSAGCATTSQMERPQKKAAPEEGLIVESVTVVGSGDRILIASNGPLEYAVYSLTDPTRIVVDVPGADLTKVSFPINVDNEYISGINAFDFHGGENSGRIVIGLRDGVEHEVRSEKNAIIVDLRKNPALVTDPATGMDAGATPALPDPGTAEPAEPAETPKPATAITGIEFSNIEGGAVISIITDGEAGRYNAFELKRPSRIVVDVWGLKNSTGKDIIRPKDSVIKSIRIGSHPDKTRFVFDAGSALPPYLVTKTGSYIVLTVGKSALARKAVENSAAENLKPAENPGVAEPSERVQVAMKDSVESGTSTNGVSKAVLPAPKAPEANPATHVKEIELMNFEGGSVVNIVTDGVVTRYSSFELKNPGRIVVDLWGVKNSTGKDSVKVKGSLIKAVRIGSHPEKTRFVFETGGSVPPHIVTKTENYIVMTVGASALSVEAENKEGSAPQGAVSEGPSGEASSHEAAVAPSEPAQAAAQASPEVTAEDEASEKALAPENTGRVDLAEAQAPEAQARPMEEDKEFIPIERIDFRKVGDRGVLTIERRAPSPYTLKESKEGMTIILDIREARLPEELRRTLDATKLKTPVTSISSFEVGPGSVRVLVELSQKVKYEVKEIDGAIAVSFVPPPAPPAPEAAAEEGKVYKGRRIDLDMVDANVSDVLRLLAEVSDLNIIASDDVVGTISLRLKNVPWDQAFDIILKAKNLDSIREGNVVRVAPAAKIRQEKEAALASRKAEEKLEDMEIKFVPVNYASAQDLESQVKGVLSERGSVTTDARTNTLIIKDIRSGIESAESLVKRLDTPIPQVLIEARIVEASTSFARDLGIQWGIDYQTTGNLSTDTFGSTATPGQTPPTSTDFPAFETHHGAQDFAVNLPATGTAGPLGALGFVLGKTGQNPLVLDLRLSAGEQEGRLRTISRPKIVTMDNREAKIEQGESIPFETTSAAGTATTFVDANLSLTVTPHITPDGSILMRIKASRNSVGTFRTAAGEPSINKKEASTEVLVRDGETTVIGGIVVSDNSETDKGIPYLKDIPLLGALFKSKSVSDSQTELLIFITPTIIKEKLAQSGIVR